MRALVGLLFVVASLLASGCTGAGGSSGVTTSLSSAAPPAPALDTGSIDGLVVTDEQEPIAGAEVSLIEAGALTKSDDAGRFTFNDLAAGSYRLAVQRLGYEAAGRRVDVRAGETTDITLELKALVVGLDPYIDVRNYKTLIAFGSALVDNRVPVQYQQCTECNRYVPITVGPESVQYEANFVNGVSGLPMEDIWFDFRRNWTNATGSQPISDGATVGYGYLKSGGKYVFAEGGIKDMRTNKVSLLWYHVASGFYAPSINKKIDAYVSFGYHAEIPEDFTALPPP